MDSDKINCNTNEFMILTVSNMYLHAIKIIYSIYRPCFHFTDRREGIYIFDTTIWN